MPIRVPKKKIMRCFSVEKLSGILKDTIPEIDFALLFGSAQKGEVKESADIDIAIYLNTSTTIDLLSKIVKNVENYTKCRCDLSILNTATEILRFEALKGKLLFVRENKIDDYALFYSLTCREYEDKIFWMKKQLSYRGYS